MRVSIDVDVDEILAQNNYIELNAESLSLSLSLVENQSLTAALR